MPDKKKDGKVVETPKKGTLGKLSAQEEKLKKFKENVDKPTDMFGKPQEVPMAKDNVLIGGPKRPNIQQELSPEYKSPRNEVGNEYTPLYQMVEQGKRGLKYLGKKFLEGASNYMDAL